MHTFFGCTGITETDDRRGQQYSGNLPTASPAYQYHKLETALDFGPTGPAAKANRMRVQISPRIIWMGLSTGNVMD